MARQYIKSNQNIMRKLNHYEHSIQINDAIISANQSSSPKKQNAEANLISIDLILKKFTLYMDH